MWEIKQVIYSAGGEMFWKVSTWETGRQDEIWADVIVGSHARALQNSQYLG
jgi:hypothetical protein